MGDAWVGLLNARELVELGAFRSAADRRRHLASRVLSRLAVAVTLGCPVEEVTIVRRCAWCGGEHGMPRVVMPHAPCHLSATHAGQRVGVALSEHIPVGVDVEPDSGRSDLGDLAGAALTDRERRWLSSGEAPPGYGTLWLWTRKEAALKAAGLGLAVPPTALDVLGATARLPTEHRPGVAVPEEPVHLYPLRPGPGHLASLASVGPTTHIHEYDGAELLQSYRPPTT